MKKASLLFSLLLFISCSDSSESNNVISEVEKASQNNQKNKSKKIPRHKKKIIKILNNQSKRVIQEL